MVDSDWCISPTINLARAPLLGERTSDKYKQQNDSKEHTIDLFSTTGLRRSWFHPQECLPVDSMPTSIVGTWHRRRATVSCWRRLSLVPVDRSISGRVDRDIHSRRARTVRSRVAIESTSRTLWHW